MTYVLMRSWLLLALVFLPGLAAAQSTATIQGQVTDAENGDPLPGANVVLYRPGETTVFRGTAADVSGNYRLENLPAGTYEVVARFVGYEDARQTVTLTAGATVTVNLALTPVELGLNPVVVTASRRQEKVLESPASISVLDARELEQTATHATVASLRYVPGVDIAQSSLNRFQVSLRGFNSVFVAKTYALVDYRQATTPSLAINAFSAMPIAPIDLARVEVVRGPNSALYGAGVEQGVIHFITKDPLTYPGTSVMIGGGERSIIQGALRHAGVINDRLGYKIVGYYSQGQDWRLDPDDPTDRELLNAIHPRWGGRDYDTWQGYVYGTLQYQLNPQTTLTASGGYSSIKQITLANTGENVLDNFSTYFAQLRLQAGGFFGQVFYTQNDDGNTHFVRSPVYVYEKSFLMSAQAQYSFSVLDDRQRFVIGADYRRTVPRTGGTIHGRFEGRDETNEVGGYVQSETRLGDALDIVLAGRLDYDDVIQKTQFSPRVAFVFKPSSTHSFRTTYNRAFTTPPGVNLFLDLFIEDRGPFGIRGVGAVDGWTFPSQVQTSSFIPGIRAWPGVGIPLAVAYQAVTAGLAAQGALPGPLVAFLQSKASQIQGFSSGLMVTPDGAVLTSLEDVPAARQTITNSYELGYKGLFANKLLVMVDLYYTRKKNFISELQPFTPLVVTPGVANDLAAAIMDAFTDDELAAYGLDRQTLAGIYQQAAAALAANPIGLIEPVENFDPNRKPELLLTYVNFGDVDYYGVDVAVQWTPDARWNLFANFSWVSDNFFDDEELGEPGTGREISMNAPRYKVGGGVTYTAPSGLSINLAGRYVDKFEVRSGIFRGTVESYFLLDLGVGYDLSRLAPGLRIDILAQNLLNNKHREYIGAPKMGRLITTRLTYTVGGY
ncbi:TonB-dependent receptor [Rhodothermus profundi]|uniref:Iron complex outermembrane recepter protein n=1 Tax=Rhodothermus profundi TaxID=633813 RepID=A0A1M6QAM7_9BACT|nr:TonB-dependent receptor [Rhodothermus profundi]SHK17208.1 iron complex outermembrane recepter protein [Rhodothermus profundi]